MADPLSRGDPGRALERAAMALLKDSSTDLYRNRAWEIAPAKTKQYYLGKAETAISAYLQETGATVLMETELAALLRPYNGDEGSYAEVDAVRDATDSAVAKLRAALLSLRSSSRGTNG